MKHNQLTAAQIKTLQRLINYNPDTGTATWAPRKNSDFDSIGSANKWRTRYEGQPIGAQVSVSQLGLPLIRRARALYAIHTGKDIGNQIIRFKDANPRNLKFKNLVVSAYSEIEKQSRTTADATSIQHLFKYLHEAFTYEPGTGHLYWNVRPVHHFKNEAGAKVFNAKFAKKRAGTLQADGRYQIHFANGMNLYVARIAWIMMTGDDPKPLIVDHIDGDSSNNKWDNLRLATTKQNAHNSVKRLGNSGHRGIRRAKNGVRWCMNFTGAGQCINATYDTLEEAVQARYALEDKYYGEFSRRRSLESKAKHVADTAISKAKKRADTKSKSQSQKNLEFSLI